uniref:Uncharacterized protein n=1 Tax=Glossina austeni TaxID=7395 RepID=A0A1A9VCZ2_GLOAU
VIIVATFHALLHLSHFIEPNTEYCFTDPTLASWIFVISVFEILWSDFVYPVHYLQLPPTLQTIIEIIIALLLTEFGTIFVWYKIENFTCYLTKSLLLAIGLHPKAYTEYEYYILGAATTIVCIAFLICLDGVCTIGKKFICERANSRKQLMTAPKRKAILRSHLQLINKNRPVQKKVNPKSAVAGNTSNVQSSTHDAYEKGRLKTATDY